MTAGLGTVELDANMDGRLRLDELVKREALTELCTSFYDLFGIPVRIYSHEGALLADVSKAQDVCAYVNTSSTGRAACASMVGEVKRSDPGFEGDVVHPCFTGAVYRVIAIDYEGRRIGRLIVGPYLPAQTVEMPRRSSWTAAGLDAEKASSLLFQMPRAKSETITRLASHLKAVLDLVLFSGHRALLTSHMHLASVRESYRELEDKNRKLQVAYDRLKELDRLKSNFLATVSHELRTPLTSIIGYSEMLTAGIAGELTPEQTEFVQTILEKGEQLLSLILSLLDLSKLESGTMSREAPPDRSRARDHAGDDDPRPRRAEEVGRAPDRASARSSPGPRRPGAPPSGLPEPHRERDQVHARGLGHPGRRARAAAERRGAGRTPLRRRARRPSGR